MADIYYTDTTKEFNWNDNNISENNRKALDEICTRSLERARNILDKEGYVSAKTVYEITMEELKKRMG